MKGARILVSEALDPVLVPAGFQPGQHGGDPTGDAHVIFCAPFDELVQRHPRLPLAYEGGPGTCFDIVVDVRADGTLDRIDLEGTSVEDALRHQGQHDLADAVVVALGGPVTAGLPAVAAGLRRLFDEHD